MNFKSILSKVKDGTIKFGKWILSDIKNMLIFILGVCAVVFFIQYRVTEKKLDNTVTRTNLEIKEYKNKNGELYAANTAYVTDIKTLKQTNQELYDEAKSLRDNPVVITKVEYVTKIDSVLVESAVYMKDTNEYTFDINYEDEWCSVYGCSDIDLGKMVHKTHFSEISFKDNLFVDLLEYEDGLMIVAKSKNPYTTINNTESVMISPEKIGALKKRFNKPWGVSVGVGVSGVYTGEKFAVLPALQINVGYKLISF